MPITQKYSLFTDAVSADNTQQVSVVTFNACYLEAMLACRSMPSKLVCNIIRHTPGQTYRKPLQRARNHALIEYMRQLSECLCQAQLCNVTVILKATRVVVIPRLLGTTCFCCCDAAFTPDSLQRNLVFNV